MANGLIQGKGFQQDSDGRRTPGYPVFIASVYTFLGDGNTWALVFSQTVLALLTIFLFAWVTWKVFASFWLALGAAMLLSIDPAVSALERYILSENLTLFL
jgi:4-amino-4-deoxy-L-arabinose transferase-like glycosyltransferase